MDEWSKVRVGWMDGWMNGARLELDGWMNGWMDEWSKVRVSWMDGWSKVRVSWMDGWSNVIFMDGWMKVGVSRMDEWRIGSWMDGWSKVYKGHTMVNIEHVREYDVMSILVQAFPDALWHSPSTQIYPRSGIPWCLTALTKYSDISQIRHSLMPYGTLQVLRYIPDQAFPDALWHSPSTQIYPRSGIPWCLTALTKYSDISQIRHSLMPYGTFQVLRYIPDQAFCNALRHSASTQIYPRSGILWCRTALTKYLDAGISRLTLIESPISWLHWCQGTNTKYEKNFKITPLPPPWEVKEFLISLHTCSLSHPYHSSP